MQMQSHLPFLELTLTHGVVLDIAFTPEQRLDRRLDLRDMAVDCVLEALSSCSRRLRIGHQLYTPSLAAALHSDRLARPSCLLHHCITAWSLVF